MTTYNATKAKFNALGEELRGVLIMFFAAFFFSLMGFFIKMLSAHHNTFEIVFFRNIVSFTILAGSMLFYKSNSKGGKPVLLVMRGVFGFSAMFCFFYSISVLPLAMASTFVKTAPIFTALFAGYILKEKAGTKVWTAIIIGFIGVLLILKPSQAIAPAGAIAGLCGGVIAAMAYTSVKGLANNYDARTIVLSFSVAGLVGSTIYFMSRLIMGDARYLSTDFIPVGVDIFYVVMVGLLASIAQWLMSVAYKYGRASVISTVSYVGLIFSTVFGYFAGDGWPGMISLFGICLVGLSGILVGMAKK
ncbi:MAG: EamA family transporter [Denitrovibrio sp.]|nr:MAG: EamA family transporter [Denitrovibrio sp.]